MGDPPAQDVTDDFENGKYALTLQATREGRLARFLAVKLARLAFELGRFEIETIHKIGAVDDARP